MSNPIDSEAPSKTRLFFVDDNETFLRVAVEFTRRHPELVAVGTALSGKEALAQVRELQPDVTLIDLNMPGMNGVDTVRRLVDVMPQMGIIILTLLDTPIYRRAAQRAGADEFVAKATMNTDLLPAIRRVAQARLAEAGEESM